MKQKHTPGPWVLKVRKHDNFTVAEIEIDASPYRGDVARLQSCEHIDGIATDELLANARLIAAAPKLLDALEAFEAEYDKVDLTKAEPPKLTAAVFAARAAIAKAKGVTE